MATNATAKKTVVFFHPDLGIGGAERLVVDAAVGLQKRGHRVVIFTSHCDPAHCFDEARPVAAGGLGLLDVRVRGGSVVPATVLGRFAILCAIARQLHLLVQVWLSGELAALQPTAFFVDQLSAGLPLLRAIGAGVPIFFYCHFPDLLLAKGRQAWWKRAYRVPFDAVEQWSMGFADAIAVNSRFTRSVVTATWPRLAAKMRRRPNSDPNGTDKSEKTEKTKNDTDNDDGLRVVYPCIDLSQDSADGADAGTLWGGRPYVLSINRFERKKDIGLAVRAFAGLPDTLKASTRLVLAGGYDARVAENVEYHRELERLAADTYGLRIATARTMATALAVPADIQVLFLLSVPSALKSLLLQSPSCRLLAYTPANEHFGIVPVEAMLAGLPVLACNSGGPTETVVEGVTGWLRAGDDVAAWTAVMDTVLTTLSPDDRARMATAGRARVRRLFSDTEMAARLDGILDEIAAAVADGTTTASSLPVSARGLLLGIAALVGLILALGLAVLPQLL